MRSVRSVECVVECEECMEYVGVLDVNSGGSS